MNAKRLTRLLDLTFAFALFMVVLELDFPYPKSIEGIWRQHSVWLRVVGFSLWYLSLWVAQYPLWDRARQVNGGAVLLGVGQAAGLLMVSCLMNWNLYYRKVRLFQGMLGGAAMLTLACCWLLARALERTNDGCHEAAARQRRTLAVAFGIVAVGVVFCVLGSQRSAVYAIMLSGLWMMGDSAVGMVAGRH